MSIYGGMFHPPRCPGCDRTLHYRHARPPAPPCPHCGHRPSVVVPFPTAEARRPDGRLRNRVLTKPASSWRSISSRPMSTPADTWTEHLCVRRMFVGFELATCGYQQGSLRPMTDDAVQSLPDTSPGPLVYALRSLGWPGELLGPAQTAMQELVKS